MPSHRKQQFVSESSDVKILKMNIYTQRYTQHTHMQESSYFLSVLIFFYIHDRSLFFKFQGISFCIFLKTPYLIQLKQNSRRLLSAIFIAIKYRVQIPRIQIEVCTIITEFFLKKSKQDREGKLHGLPMLIPWSPWNEKE